MNRIQEHEIFNEASKGYLNYKKYNSYKETFFNNKYDLVKEIMKSYSELIAKNSKYEIEFVLLFNQLMKNGDLAEFMKRNKFNANWICPPDKEFENCQEFENNFVDWDDKIEEIIQQSNFIIISTKEDKIAIIRKALVTISNDINEFILWYNFEFKNTFKDSIGFASYKRKIVQNHLLTEEKLEKYAKEIGLLFKEIRDNIPNENIAQKFQEGNRDNCKRLHNDLISLSIELYENIKYVITYFDASDEDQSDDLIEDITNVRNNIYDYQYYWGEYSEFKEPITSHVCNLLLEINICIIKIIQKTKNEYSLGALLERYKDIIKNQSD